MSNFAERLRLKERVEEDIYFAKRDRELIEALKKAKRRKPTPSPGTEPECLQSTDREQSEG